MKNKNVGREILKTALSLFVNALVLMMASSIFKGFYIDSFWVAVLTAAVISLLNGLVKPLLVFLTLPITIYTLGLFYPFINVLILKLASFIIGKSLFSVEGIIIPVFIALFISFMNILLDKLIVKPIAGE